MRSLTATPLVSLGGHALAVASYSGAQITADLPAGQQSGSYDLAVTAKTVPNFDVTLGR